MRPILAFLLITLVLWLVEYSDKGSPIYIEETPRFDPAVYQRKQVTWNPLQWTESENNCAICVCDFNLSRCLWRDDGEIAFDMDAYSLCSDCTLPSPHDPYSEVSLPRGEE